MRVAIVDYGMGNIRSLVSALKYLGVSQIHVSADFCTLSNADKLILPGVGAFGKAMQNIREKELDKHLEWLVLEKKKPILGICLGMQLFANSSDEDGLHEGLGFIDVEVRKFTTQSLKIPHVGINQVIVNSDLLLYSGLSNKSDFYFTHSYRMLGSASFGYSICEYGEAFVAGFEKENMAGVQFHPELSQKNGLKLISNFLSKF